MQLEDTSTAMTAGDQQPNPSNDSMTRSALLAEDGGIQEGEVSEDQNQIEDAEDTSSCDPEMIHDDISPGEPVVAEAVGSARSIDVEVFREDETRQEPSIPSEGRSFVQLELPQTLKVRVIVKILSFISSKLIFNFQQNECVTYHILK